MIVIKDDLIIYLDNPTVCTDNLNGGQILMHNYWSNNDFVLNYSKNNCANNCKLLVADNIENIK